MVGPVNEGMKAKPHRHKANYYNDIALKLAHQLFGVEHLHYGYFDRKLPATRENLPRAQGAYVQNLLSFLPKKGLKRVFDVGCGTGGVARELVKRKLELVCLAPDPYLIERTRENTGGKARTITDLYENVTDEVGELSMDLILMSESCQYVNIAEGFANHRRFLRPGGHLLVADFFRIKPADARNPSRSGHMLEQYLAAARENGFRLVKEQDITERVAPTMDIYQDFISNKIFPVVEGIFEIVRRAAPRLHRLLGWIFGGKIRAIKSKYEKQGAALFSEYKRYMIYLFQKEV